MELYILLRELDGWSEMSFLMQNLFSFVLQIGTSAGGGGQSSCPGGDGGNGGNAGNWSLFGAPKCYDESAEGGNAGTSALGGGGGTELTSFVIFGLLLNDNTVTGSTATVEKKAR